MTGTIRHTARVEEQREVPCRIGRDQQHGIFELTSLDTNRGAARDHMLIGQQMPVVADFERASAAGLRVARRWEDKKSRYRHQCNNPSGSSSVHGCERRFQFSGA